MTGAPPPPFLCMKGVIMRTRSLVSLLAMSAALGIWASTAAAQPLDAPGWCALVQGPDGGYVACEYRTRAQCLAALAGIGGICHENPTGDGHGVGGGEKPRRHRTKEM